MAGNVAEWVTDWYDTAYYRSSPLYAPAGPRGGEAKVIRGGGWLEHPLFTGVTVRWSKWPEYRSNDLGFRCAKDTPE